MYKMDNLDEFCWNYDNYKSIIHEVKNTQKYVDLSTALEKNTFIVIRHDVEFSVDRAYKLARIETDLGICTSYFFQITNNTYNCFSKKNLEMIREMYNDGHYIGLHFHLNGLSDIDEIKKAILFQSNILGEMLGINIDRFSYHRPPKELLEKNLSIDGLINAYDKRLFTYVPLISEGTELEIKYVSDSMHRWNYGIPNKGLFEKNEKVQLLIHPYSWSKEGFNNKDNFESLITEKTDELIQSIDSECKHFKMVKDKIYSKI